MLESDQVTAALVIIGNEILSGRTQDKNVAYAGECLNENGIVLSEVRVVPDIESRIVSAVNELRAHYKYVFTTGGIGPTHDDITSESIAAAFSVPWEMNSDAFAILERYYDEGQFTPPRQKMAMMPMGSRLIPNPVSGAPGFYIENVYVMAGIPSIMQAMLDSIIPMLQGGASILSRTVVCSQPESEIAEKLGLIQKRYTCVDIGSYPRYQNGRFLTSLVLRGTDEETVTLATRDVADMIRDMGEEPDITKENPTDSV